LRTSWSSNTPVSFRAGPPARQGPPAPRLRATRLETELGERLSGRDAGWIRPREAGAAELVLGPHRRRLDAVERDIRERRRADLPPHRFDRARRGDELLLVGEVDPVEARRDD